MIQKFMNFLDEFLDLAALRSFNRYAVITAGGLLFFLLFKTIFFHLTDYELKKIFSEKSKETASSKVSNRAVNQKPYSFYSEQIGDKNFFSASSKLSALSSQNGGGSPLKNIILVGILPGDNPQAALENKETQKTYYLSKNQSIENMRVKDIRDNAVILEYNGETETLTL